MTDCVCEMSVLTCFAKNDLYAKFSRPESYIYNTLKLSIWAIKIGS